MTPQSVLNSFVFWSAWIIIPLIVEIVPSFASVIVLARRRFRDRKPAPDPSLWPEVSLIVPVYNSAETLEACLASIATGTYPAEQLRVFLVDNGSTDDSFEVFGRCQDRFPSLRMQWLSADQGKSKALNMALYNAEGKYIVNIDSDGVLEPNALMNLVRKFENHPGCRTHEAVRDRDNPHARPASATQARVCRVCPSISRRSQLLLGAQRHLHALRCLLGL